MEIEKLNNNDFFYRITDLKNHIEIAKDRSSVVIRQTVTVDSSRAATLFVSQHIDDYEMIEAVRYPVDKGVSTLELKELKIVNPQLEDEDGAPVYYQLAVAVMAAGVGVREAKERISFHPDALKRKQ